MLSVQKYRRLRLLANRRNRPEPMILDKPVISTLYHGHIDDMGEPFGRVIHTIRHFPWKNIYGIPNSITWAYEEDRAKAFSEHLRDSVVKRDK